MIKKNEIKLFTFIKYVKPYLKYLIITCLCCISCSILSMSVPIGIGNIIDLINEKSNIKNVYIFAFVVIICLLVGSILSFIANYTYSKLNGLVINDIRLDIYKHINMLPMSYFAKEKEGTIISYFLNDLGAIQNVTTSLLLGVITDMLVLLTVLGTLFLTNYKLGILAFSTMIIYIFILKFSKGLKEIAIKNQEKLSEITSVLQETISGIKIIKLFTFEENQIILFKNKLISWLNTNMKLVIKSSYSREIANFYTSIAPIIFLCYGVVLIKQGHISVGKLITYYTLLGRLYGPCSRLTNLNITLQTGLSAMDRISKFLSIDSEIYITEKNHNQINGKVEFRNVYFEYEPNRPILENINIHIDEGQVVGIVGKSGSGKSTLADLITKIINPIHGKILMDNIDINTININELRKNISVVSQDVFLFNNSIIENIRYGNPNASEIEVIKAAKAANAYEFIKNLPNQYNTIVGNRGHMLSVGQCQRISIARAFLKNAKIIIWDEATSSLDSTSQRLVKEALFNIMKGKTCIIISHRLSVLEQCNTIYVIDKGSIIETGSHDSLMDKKGLYWNLLKEDLVKNMD